MRRFVVMTAAVLLAAAGCSGVFQRQSTYRATPTPVAPGSGGGLSPVPDLGEPTVEPPVGPTLEGPVFPDSARRRMRTIPASNRQPQGNPVPQVGYYELPPAP